MCIDIIMFEIFIYSIIMDMESLLIKDFTIVAIPCL